MPPLDTMLQSGLRVHTLLYGQDHTRKTTWAGRAAEFGFHVVFLDCDDKPNVLHQLSGKAKKRVHVIGIKDKHDRECAQEFVACFLKEAVFAWNEEEKKPIFWPSQLDLSRSYYVVNALKLNRNTVVVCDSWTKLIASIQNEYCRRKNIDKFAAEKLNDLQDYFGACGQAADHFMNMLHVFDCHMIVIGHSTIYEKNKTQKKNYKGPREVEWSREQLISTSGPKSFGYGQKFDDILYFYQPAKGMFMISTQGDQDRMGGCTLIPPGDFAWNDLQFDWYVKNGYIAQPDLNDTCEAFKFYPAGSIEDPETLGLGPGRLQLTNAPLDVATAQSTQISVGKSPFVFVK